MSKVVPKQKFTIYGDLKVDATIEIEAESLEAAVAASKTLKPTNFITFVDDNGYLDAELEIRGAIKA